MSDDKIMVWRKNNEELEAKNMRVSVKYGGGSIMIWCCIAACEVGKLRVIYGNVDRFKCLQVLKDSVKESAKTSDIELSCQFSQSDDPKHKSRIVQEWLLRHCPKVVGTTPHFLDFNIIENICDILNDNIRKHQISKEQRMSP